MYSWPPTSSERSIGKIYTNDSIQRPEDNTKKEWDQKNTYALNINDQYPNLTNFEISVK